MNPIWYNAVLASAGPNLKTGLISFWELEEASGTRVDAHGSNNLTDVNTVTQATGKVGNAAQFTAANSEELNIADNASLSTGDIDFTLAAWVYLDTLPTTGSIMTKWTSGGNQREHMMIYQTGLFRFFVSSNGSASSSVSATTFGAPSTATWYFVVGWHDAANNVIGISVNGTANTASYSSGVFDSSSDFRIGTAGFGGAFMDGRIDQAGFWKKVLSTEEKTFLYNSGNGRAYSAL